MSDPNQVKPRKVQYVGCLLGGAIGDALGAPVEFLSVDEIRQQFGPAGITHFAEAYGRVGAITDDTQMTLFTADGLMRAHNRLIGRGIVDIASVVHHAYLTWLRTQGQEPETPVRGLEYRGLLFDEPALHTRRAPGNTCVSALASGQWGRLEEHVPISVELRRRSRTDNYTATV